MIDATRTGEKKQMKLQMIIRGENKHHMPLSTKIGKQFYESSLEFYVHSTNFIELLWSSARSRKAHHS